MVFGPNLAEQLLAFDKPLVAAVAPHRKLDLAALKASVQAGGEDAYKFLYEKREHALGWMFYVNGLRE
jgi:hypothetical protein